MNMPRTIARRSAALLLLLLSSPAAAAGDATATVDLAAVTNFFETRRYADFAIGDVAYHVYVPI